MVYLLNLFDSDNKEENEKEIKELPKVAIIVPAYNEGENIVETINSLSNLNYPKEKYEIIVVDDGSKDNTYKKAKETADKINKKLNINLVSVYRKENGGKASALNFGIKKVLDKVDYVVCMDADSIVEKNSLKELVKTIESSGKEYMACVSTMNVYKPKNWLEKMQAIEYYISNFFKKLFFASGWIYITPGPFSLYRAEFFKKHGFFKEDDITEDTEIGIRINAKGYKITYAENSFVYTKTPKTIKSLIKQRIRWYLGLIDDIAIYKKSLKKMGELGLFVLPSVLLMRVLLFLIGYLLFKDFFDSLINKIKEVLVLRFDVIYLIKDYFENLSFHFSFTYYHFFFIVSFIFLLFFFLNSLYSYEKSENDRKWVKDKKNLAVWLIYFILIYPFFYLIFISLTILAKLFGRKLRFGNLEWRNSLLNNLIDKLKLKFDRN